MKTRKVIYKVTYPNGKIYVGQDVTDTPNYFGSGKSSAFRSDFTVEELDVDFTVRKSVVWASMVATREEVNKMERHFILEFGANNPAIGYNLRPKWKIQ